MSQAKITTTTSVTNKTINPNVSVSMRWLPTAVGLYLE